MGTWKRPPHYQPLSDEVKTPPSEFLADEAETLGLLREAARMPYCRVAVRLSTSFPFTENYWRGVLSGTRLLCLKSLYSAEKGKQVRQSAPLSTCRVSLDRSPRNQLPCLKTFGLHIPARSAGDDNHVGLVRPSGIGISKLIWNLWTTTGAQPNSLPTKEWLQSSRLTQERRRCVMDFSWRSLVPSHHGNTLSNDLGRMILFRTVLAALAVERHRLRTESLPDRLQNVVPVHLDAVPTDPFDGEPLHYKKLTSGCSVYSVGRNRIDDGEAKKGNMS